MASVGTITGVSMQGVIHTPKSQVTQYIRDGIAGSGYTKTVTHGVISQVITHHPLVGTVDEGPPEVITPPATIYATLRNEAYALIGTVVTVVDAFGETFNNVVVKDCTVSQAVAATGSAGLYCSISWQLIAEANVA